MTYGYWPGRPPPSPPVPTPGNLKPRLKAQKTQEEFNRAGPGLHLLLRCHASVDNPDIARHHHSAERRKTFTITLESCSRPAGICVHDALETVNTMRADQNAIANEFAADLATISKVHIVASDDTIEAVLTYMNELGPAFMEMTRHRMPLAIRKQMIETHAALMSKAGADRERFIALLQQYTTCKA
jgi:hypothetical protein